MPLLPLTTYPNCILHNQGGQSGLLHRVTAFCMRQSGATTCRRPWASLRLVSCLWPPATLRRWLHSLTCSRPSTCGPEGTPSPCKNGKAYLSVDEGPVNALRHSRPNSCGSYYYPFTWRLRLAPNSSPSKMRFNPGEPNLQLFGEFIPKVSPPRVRVEASLGFCLLLQKTFKRYCCIVLWWYYCPRRSITAHNYVAISG
jgi:hypothetical protein